MTVGFNRSPRVGRLITCRLVSAGTIGSGQHSILRARRDARRRGRSRRVPPACGAARRRAPCATAAAAAASRRLDALREEGSDDPGQHVPCARCRERRRPEVAHDHVPPGRGDDRVGALEQDDRGVSLRRIADGFEPVRVDPLRVAVEQPSELARMRREYRRSRASDRLELEERIGVDYGGKVDLLEQCADDAVRDARSARARGRERGRRALCGTRDRLQRRRRRSTRRLTGSSAMTRRQRASSRAPRASRSRHPRAAPPIAVRQAAPVIPGWPPTTRTAPAVYFVSPRSGEGRLEQ